ncbi:MAG: hypothetical protein WCK15_24165, partial [Pirellula sp.]
VIDKDGGFTDYDTVVLVNNVAPTATIGNNGPMNEGSPATVSLTIANDVSAADLAAGLHYSFATTTAGLAASYAAASASGTASFAFTDNGTYTVFGRVIDKDGGFTDYSNVIVVNNVAPTAVMSNNGPVNAGNPVTIKLNSPLDPSSVDTSAGFRYSFATTATGLASSYATASASNTSAFTLTTAGNHTIYGRIFDKDGGFTNYTSAIVVNAATPVDVTSLVTFNYYGAQYNTRTKTYAFYGTITNISNRPIRGPIQLAWSTIAPSTANAIGSTGTWTDGSPYFDLSGFVSSDGILQPGEVSQPRTFALTVVAPGAYSFVTRVRGIPASNGGSGEGESLLDFGSVSLVVPVTKGPESHVATIADLKGSNTIMVVAWGGTAEAYGSGVVAHDILGNSDRMPKEADTGAETSFWPEQNSVDRMDVIEDSLAQSLNAFSWIINGNAKGSRSVLPESIGHFYFDTSDDKNVSRLDDLILINRLRRNRGTGENDANILLNQPAPALVRKVDEYFGSIFDEPEKIQTSTESDEAALWLSTWQDRDRPRSAAHTPHLGETRSQRTNGEETHYRGLSDLELNSILEELVSDLRPK